MDSTQTDTELPCPICGQNTVTSTEILREFPYIGTTKIYTLRCQNEACDFKETDIDPQERQEPVSQKYVLRSPEGLSTRVVRSSNGEIYFEGVGSILPGRRTTGFVTNIEGIINRMLEKISFYEQSIEAEEDRALLRKRRAALEDAKKGLEPLTIYMVDDTGNSAILSPETENVDPTKVRDSQ